MSVRIDVVIFSAAIYVNNPISLKSLSNRNFPAYELQEDFVSHSNESNVNAAISIVFSHSVPQGPIALIRFKMLPAVILNDLYFSISCELYYWDYKSTLCIFLSTSFYKWVIFFLFFQKNILNLMHSFPEKIRCSFHVTQQSTPICPELQPFITGEWVLMAGYSSNIHHELLEHTTEECRGLSTCGMLGNQQQLDGFICTNSILFLAWGSPCGEICLAQKSFFSPSF